MGAWGTALGFAGAMTGRHDFSSSGERGLHAAALFSWLAMSGLAYALAVGDMRLRYVASWASAATPLPYRLGAVWAGPSGSLLVWASILALGASLGVAALPRRSAVRAWSAALLALLTLAVLLMAGFDTNPFLKLTAIPDDGRGLPLEWMRPVVLGQMPVGYLAMALVPIPAVMAVMGALGTAGTWRDVTRRWTLGVLALLSFAIVLDWRRRYGIGDWADDWRWAPVAEGTAFAWVGVALLASTLLLAAREGLIIAAAFAAFALGLGGLTMRRAGGWDGTHVWAISPMGRGAGWLLAVVLLLVVAAVWGTPARARFGRAMHAALAAMLMAAVGLCATGFPARHDITLSEGGTAQVTDRLGTPWVLTLDGLSIAGRGNVDVGIVAVRAAVNGRTRAFVSAEDRQLYQRDAREAQERLTVSGLAGGTVQDFRLDLLETTRSSALLSVRFVPLASLVWLGAIGAALALGVAALAPVTKESSA